MILILSMLLALSLGLNVRLLIVAWAYRRSIRDASEAIDDMLRTIHER